MSTLISNWGKSRTFLVTVVDGGSRVDLTGKTLRFTAKLSREDPDPAMVDKSTGSGIVHLDQTQTATRGQAQITISGTDTSSHRIHPNKETTLQWDLELIDGTNTFVVDSGTWSVTPSVRRT